VYVEIFSIFVFVLFVLIQCVFWWFCCHSKVFLVGADVCVFSCKFVCFVVFGAFGILWVFVILLF